jgi:hypothetical protein
VWVYVYVVLTEPAESKLIILISYRINLMNS